MWWFCPVGGSMFENGPVTIGRYPAGYFGIDPQVPLQSNVYAWTNATAIMYVEQPHGTGFSTGPVPTNETDVSRDFYHFLQNLYTIFDGSDHDWRQKQLYFFGESYAGMFVPSIAHYIYKQNMDRNKNGHRHINLAGIALGNGWMDAQVQGPAVIDYAWWHGMIDTSTVKALKNEWENCKSGVGHQPHPFHKFTIPDECGIMGAVLQAAGMGVVDWGTPNAYDVTTWDP
jgi:carboxypeptidase D